MLQSYPWYVGDWRASETRVNLTLEERGLYRELLDSCYIERSLPTDERKLARIANCSDEEFARCWPAVKTLFSERNDRYFHGKVSEVLGKLDGYSEQRREAGRISGQVRRTKRTSVTHPVQFSLPKKATKNEPSQLNTSQQEERTPPTPSLPEWRSDEVFVRFESDYRSTGAPLIDEDFIAAYRFGWKPLDWEQRALRVKALVALLPQYRRDPTFTPKPEKFLKQEWKRPPRPENGSSYDQNSVDYAEYKPLRRND